MRRTWLVSICALLLAGSFQLPAQATSLSELRNRLSRYLSRERQVTRQLRSIKGEQQQARSGLISAQKQLAQAQARLREAEAKLHKTKQHVAETEQELAETKARLDKHEAEMQQYLLALYRAGEPTYLEVVFQATSFQDFVTRAEFTRRLAQRDEELLTALVSEKQAYESKRAELLVLRARQEDLRAQIKQEQAKIKVQAAAARRELKEVTQDRAAAEQELAQMQQQSRQIEQMLARLQRGGGQSYSGSWSGSLKCPIWDSYRISSQYGYRIHPILGGRRFHDGVDLACPTGTPIHAADKGLVIYTGWRGGYGRTILIDHGSGISTMYAHCSRYAVQKGQAVNRGQVIGYVGSTGLSTGPHLHFGLRKYGKPINPMKF
ncbi:MAG: peptidoglycan DD-metalloendopeptidase family protein [Armatimonadetes bacterium]|nr:peptidoglycan DD-metalloendopeptidase family protein [Armatimonadota bacterium]